GLVIGLVAMAAATVAVKLAAALIPIPSVYVPYVEAVSALAMVGGGAAALAVRSPRPRLAYLAVGQLGWVAAGLATHFRSGTAASLFLLGAFAVAATCGPARLGRAARAGRGAAGDHRLLDRRRGRVLPRDRRLRRVRLPDPRPGRPGGRSAGAAVVLHTPLSPAHSPWLEGIARVDSRAPNVDYVAANVLEVPPGRIQEALSGSNPGSPTEQTKVATPPDASDAGGPDRKSAV